MIPYEVTCIQEPEERELVRIVDLGDGKSLTLTGWSALLWEFRQLQKKITEREKGHEQD